jgi:hypothetical protein
MKLLSLFILPIVINAFNISYIYEKAIGKLPEFKTIKSNLTFTSRSLGNPGGTYGAFIFPDSETPFSLRYFEKKMNLTKFFNSSITSTVMNNKDAIVLLIKLPPPNTAQYFSIINYVLARFNSTKTHWLAGVPLNDPINNLIINSTNNIALIISTGDVGIFNKISNSFIKAGVNKNAINFLPIPSDKVKFRHYIQPWILDKSDLISWHFRVSSYNKSDESILEYLNTNWEYYLLRHRNGLRYTDEPIPAYSMPLRIRETNTNQSYLTNKYNSLINNIIKKENKTLRYILPLNHVIPDFNQCLTNNSYYPIFYPIPEWNFKGIPGFCDFFVRDALYSIYPNTNSSNEVLKDFKFYNNRTFISIGINQVLMNQCIYSNLLITTLSHPEDPNHTFNLTATDLINSANKYGNNFNEFYAYKWTRKCNNESYCQEVNENQINSTSDWITFAERKYLNPNTKIGPSPNELLQPIILVFDEI